MHLKQTHFLREDNKYYIYVEKNGIKHYIILSKQMIKERKR